MNLANLCYDFNTYLDQLQATLGLKAYGRTQLYTTDLEGILVTDDGSMVSLLSLEGSLQLMGEAEFLDLLEKLNTMLMVTLSQKSHALQVVFQYDPKSQENKLKQHFSLIKYEASNLNLDLKGVLEDWEEKLEEHCAEEAVYLAFWTRPTALSKAELKREKKNLRSKNLPSHPDLQGKEVRLERLRELHLAQVRKLLEFFRAAHFKMTWLDSHAAILAIRKAIAPQITSSDWRPCLGDDLRWPKAKADGSPSYDLSHLLPPMIVKQVWPTSAKIIDRRLIQIGSRLYAPFWLELPPQNLLPFNQLLMSMAFEMPFRVAFLLTGDGLGELGLKQLMAQILAFTSRGNKMYSEAYKALQEAALEGVCVVGLQASFVTWVDMDEEDKAKEKLRAASCRFQTQVQSWGSCETCDLLGDPLLGFETTVPALTPTSAAPKALAPLKEALSLLPLTRPTSPWDQGDLPLRTPCGKFMPMGLFHSSQASWNEVVFAGMGAGKSFFLNTLNFFFLLRPGQARLPWLTVIDIGPSSSGVINLIKWALPSNLRHLAVFAKLKNRADRAINPFDTPLGCPYPLQSHAEFLNNLLQLLCTPLDKTAPVDGVPALLREAVDQLYKALSPRGERPKYFDEFSDSEITSYLEEANFKRDNQTTWWEVVEFLFEEKQYHLALKAQRFAMPLMGDLAAIVTDPKIAENYQGILAGEGKENVPSACSRYLLDAINEFPILSNPTQFSLGSAQIIGLDLYEVTPRGGHQAQRQSGIMYMLARFVGAAHFFNTVDDLEQIPVKYRSYHRPRLENLMADPKRLCYDEFHRASCQDLNNPLSKQIISDLTTATREARKLNLSIGLYSQRLEDFPKELVALATSIYALGAGNQAEAKEIAERFGFNHAAFEALRQITRPTSSGANFIALYRTEYGESIQYLTNSVGSFAKWAFSTTAEDMRLRNALYDRLGCRQALALLQHYYPKGSIKGELERRKANLGAAYNQDGLKDLEAQILQELMDKSENFEYER